MAENLYSEIQFPAHVISASSEAVDGEAWRVATGRRSVRDRWAPAGFNAEAWIRVVCDQERAADVVVLDRGHNLAGRRVLLQCSPDGFAAVITTVLDVVLPSAAVEGGQVDEAAGVLTEEGAWIRRFPSVSARAWRLLVPALGAEIRPEVVGLWLGTSWTPLEYFDLPWGEESIELRVDVRTTPAGWTGYGRTARPRVGEIGLKLHNSAEYQLARYHIWQQYWAPRPMWIVYDDARAERAVLAVPPPGRYGFEQEEGWHPRQARVAWIEHEPRSR